MPGAIACRAAALLVDRRGGNPNVESPNVLKRQQVVGAASCRQASRLTRGRVLSTEVEPQTPRLSTRLRRLVQAAGDLREDVADGLADQVGADPGGAGRADGLGRLGAGGSQRLPLRGGGRFRGSAVAHCLPLWTANGLPWS